MKEKLKEILDEYEETIVRYETQSEKLVTKMDFCASHNFTEEFRIANVEYQALNMCIYRWRKMHIEITALLTSEAS